ncbi:NhaP-type Na+/H+ or K+/H+ antiporter [Oikeobacillus pervagus]|uniref:NhaP-type Na+/H+ or K+/H+ antiporter n=1 Tax=Oikeobacillus pervagus TaxID=1325931 RepID=A0AAJ1T8N9_9BACI|nr:hypothetical protein [Oikeobacillus pervagus]MDQ0216650.1 NhaP-type Na+/H+ or K+/H+ antiporter [Oikeobacillus pervagus]
MDSILSAISCIGVVIYFTNKYRDVLAKMTAIQKIGIFISYAITTLISAAFIYYGGRLLTAPFQNGLLIFIIRFAVVIVVLRPLIITLNWVLQKITNGIFPKIT